MTLHPVTFNNPKLLEWDDIKSKVSRRLKYAAQLDIPHLPQCEAHDGTAVVVGAAPSLEIELDKIRALKQDGKCTVFSINGAHDYLIKNGIIPNIQVIFEWDLEDVRTALNGVPHKDVVYYICSHCHPRIYKQLGASRQVMWHVYAWMQQYQNLIANYFPGEFMVGGGHVTFFRSLTIAVILGHRKFELFGLDSSFNESSHIENYFLADIEPKLKLWGTNPHSGDKRQFQTQGGLAFQAHEFLTFCASNQEGLSLRVHGDGLLRYLHQARYPEQYQERN